ncbi:MAG TPA: hypothetical protein VMY99_02250 [Nevskiaceae bacterium]|nr:hypothetical protein [Nevskiaceae bacterium]
MAKATQSMPAAIKNHTQAGARQEFLVFCPAITKDSGALEAVEALYYLPNNYKLVFGTDALAEDAAMYKQVVAWAKQSWLMDRVRFDKKTGMSDVASPFSFAGAVVYGHANQAPVGAAAKAITVSGSTHSAIAKNDHGGFTVSSSSPEAMASAILKVAHAA